MIKINTTTPLSFCDVWTHFEISLRNHLLKNTRFGLLPLETANTILYETSLVWFSPTTTEGLWLQNLKESLGEESIEISNILHNDLHFYAYVKGSNIDFFVKYGLPTLGLILTKGLVGHFGGGIFLKNIFGCSAAAGIYNTTKNLGIRLKNSNKSTLVDAYLQQLNVVKNKIIKILNKG